MNDLSKVTNLFQRIWTFGGMYDTQRDGARRRLIIEPSESRLIVEVYWQNGDHDIHRQKAGPSASAERALELLGDRLRAACSKPGGS